jgi:RHS repeat-associated protein
MLQSQHILPAFGMGMFGRSSGNEYAFGFNGKREEKEFANGVQDFGARMYDEKLGRFFSTDPFTKFMHNKTPYCFAGNSPITFIDKNGGFQIPPKVAKYAPELEVISIAISNAVNADPSMNNPLIKEFIVAAGLDANDPNSINEALQVLSYGSGPMVQIDPKLGFDAYGEFREETPGTIFLSKTFVKELKDEVTHVYNLNKKSWEEVKGSTVNGANMLWMMMTFWHEAIHYSDYCNDGISQARQPTDKIGRPLPNSFDAGLNGEEEIYNCNRPSSPFILSQIMNTNSKVNRGRSVQINIDKLIPSGNKVTLWFHDNSKRSVKDLKDRLIMGTYVFPNSTPNSKGTTKSSSDGSSSYQNSRYLD